MPETVFWDTVAFVALGNAKDGLHQMAVNVSQELAQAQAQVLATDLTPNLEAEAGSSSTNRPARPPG